MSVYLYDEAMALKSFHYYDPWTWDEYQMWVCLDILGYRDMNPKVGYGTWTHLEHLDISYIVQYLCITNYLKMYLKSWDFYFPSMWDFYLPPK